MGLNPLLSSRLQAAAAGPSLLIICCHPTACRIYITFEELPVQNIAVGNTMMRFTTMHTAKSLDNIAGEMGEILQLHLRRHHCTAPISTAETTLKEGPAVHQQCVIWQQQRARNYCHPQDVYFTHCLAADTLTHLHVATAR
jgi:hypothetical protein